MDSSSFDICTTPTDFYRLASGLRAFFLIIGTHLLAGEVDTTLSDAPLWERLSWLLRYFNPVNLSWRYYSILSYRVAVQARARTRADAGDWDDAVGMAEAGAGGGCDGDHISGGGGGSGSGEGLGGLCWTSCRWARAGTSKAKVERMSETGGSSGGSSGSGGQTGGCNCLCWTLCRWGRVGNKANVEHMAETGGSSGGSTGSDQTSGCSCLCCTPRRWGRAGAKANLECTAETGDGGSNQTVGHGDLHRNSSGGCGSHGPGILRCTPGHAWGDTQMAIINHEAHPFKSPLPYAVAENHAALHVRRLEPAGLFSSQGILTVSAGFQGVLALQYTVSTAGVAFLPNMTMPLAIMGLFRTAVSPWITSKVYVDPHCYPSQDVPASDYKPNRLLVSGWVCILSGLVFLSFWPFLAYPAFDLPQDLMKLWIQIFYQYATISTFLVHAVLLRHGSLAWANRILFFDHWVYKVQTLGFMSILLCMLALGVSDFVRQDYYRHCG